MPAFCCIRTRNERGIINMYRVDKKVDPLKFPHIAISRNLLYEFDSCFELVIRKAAQALTHLEILGC